MKENKVPIAMICDRNFIMQTKVAIASLKKNKNIDTVYDVFVILVDGNEEDARNFKVISSEDCYITARYISVEKYSHIKQIAHVPLASLVKFDLCELIPEYDKILYLDGDIIVREDLCELYDFDLNDAYVAGVPHSIGIITGEKKINGGILLFNAKKIRDEHLQKVFIKTRESLGERKSMDQETFHMVFGDKKIFLPPKYNVMIDKVDYEKKYYSVKSYNEFYGTEYKTRKEIVKTAAIIHFTGSIKPWKYDFAKCGKEWVSNYKNIYGDDTKLLLKDKKTYYKEQIEKNGLRCVYWMMKDKILQVIGDVFHIFLDRSYGQWN
ncbi:MAG: hypothetical protein J6J79_09900 [Lachnospiraceae bacterium]|nr:hypothetical protein [Lachnospiraceae bacterium]